MSETILVVDASVGETPAERNLTRELDTETAVYKPPAGELPPPVAGGQCFDGVVVSGSQTAVYEDRDWIHRLTTWVRDVHAADIPVVGICWGHQFLAQALGGRVVAMDEHELGYRTVERVAEDPLFADIPESFTAFQTHSDRVAELPPGAIELAANDYGTQAFRLGSSYGVQFHPEYDLETAEWVLERKSLPAETRRTVEAGLTEDNTAAARDIARVFDNLLTLTGEHGRQPERRV